MTIQWILDYRTSVYWTLRFQLICTNPFIKQLNLKLKICALLKYVKLIKVNRIKNCRSSINGRRPLNELQGFLLSRHVNKSNILRLYLDVDHLAIIQTNWSITLGCVSCPVWLLPDPKGPFSFAVWLKGRFLFFDPNLFLIQSLRTGYVMLYLSYLYCLEGMSYRPNT
jgi:hypothetical protein